MQSVSATQFSAQSALEPVQARPGQLGSPVKPAGASMQAPSVPDGQARVAPLQASHCPLHAVLQHTPSTQ